jgi:hypothetical protein
LSSVTGEFEIEIEKVHVPVFPWNILHELSNNPKPTNGIGLAGGSRLAARCSQYGVVWVDESHGSVFWQTHFRRQLLVAILAVCLLVIKRVGFTTNMRLTRCMGFVVFPGVRR